MNVLSRPLRAVADDAGASDALTVQTGQRPAKAVDTAGSTDAVSLRRRITLADTARAADDMLVNGLPAYVDTFDTSWGGADLGNDRVTILNAALVPNARHGNLVRDWAGRTSVPLTGCSVQPYSAAEVTADREFTATHVKLFAPFAAAGVLAATSRVLHDGITYEVDGEPARWRDLDGRPSHVEAALKRLNG